MSAKDFGQFYGFEARDEASGTLLARAKQVKIEGQILVVEETQYSADGAAMYKGKLFFDESDRLVREQRVEGQKKWGIFHTSMKESVGCHEHAIEVDTHWLWVSWLLKAERVGSRSDRSQTVVPSR